MSIHAVIFDFGGVLVRTEDDSRRRKWEAQFGLPPGALERLVFESEASARCSLGLLPESEVWKHIQSTLGLNHAELEEFRRDFWSGDRLDDELVNWLRGLRPGRKTAILSNAWSEARSAFTEIYRLGDAFDLIVISAEEGLMKPDAGLYRLTAERLGVRPEQAVFVDDMARNVEGARAAGLRAVQFQSTPQVIAEVGRQLDG